MIPNHVAVIMDGNARWAKLHKVSKNVGYKEGIKSFERLVKICINLQIKILTVFTLSTENTKRKDINILYSLIREFIKKNKDLNQFNEIEFRLIGDRSNISVDILNYFQELENKVNSDKKLILNLAYNYGSWNELENCIKAIINQYSKNNNLIINEKKIKNNLFTKDLPDPDILIRTGGNKRLSNFLLLQLKYTELFFIDELWPDFNEITFKKIIKDFNKRNRTFGV